jgi:hypothetical protein
MIGLEKKRQNERPDPDLLTPIYDPNAATGISAARTNQNHKLGLRHF